MSSPDLVDDYESILRTICTKKVTSLRYYGRGKYRSTLLLRAASRKYSVSRVAAEPVKVLRETINGTGLI